MYVPLFLSDVVVLVIISFNAVVEVTVVSTPTCDVLAASIVLLIIAGVLLIIAGVLIITVLASSLLTELVVTTEDEEVVIGVKLVIVELSAVLSVVVKLEEDVTPPEHNKV